MGNGGCTHNLHRNVPTKLPTNPKHTKINSIFRAITLKVTVKEKFAKLISIVHIKKTSKASFYYPSYILLEYRRGGQGAQIKMAGSVFKINLVCVDEFIRNEAWMWHRQGNLCVRFE